MANTDHKHTRNTSCIIHKNHGNHKKSWTHTYITPRAHMHKNHGHTPTRTWMTTPALLILTKRLLSLNNLYHRTILVAARRFANNSAK